ncbi:M10 family metallopeptidase [Kordiimonas laminariae]|uniref:M10 family metallopeptidase n=1 Tax=Kordiimonas laminariae TaxID=2917717 RepID=UPI001FF61C64|nr:matrixin family metalloprotease [Kordiimonas laminariae]MCK0070592.1 matrixin family metalloprotease [Kordiimonas laminariae]
MCVGSSVCNCNCSQQTSAAATSENTQSNAVATGIDDVASTITAAATGTQTIDALIAGRIYAPDAGSTATTLSYSFGGPNSVYSSDSIVGYRSGEDLEPVSGVLELSNSAKALFEDALNELRRYTNLEFEEVEDTASTAGTLRIAWSEIEDEDAVGWAYLPGNTTQAGDIWLIAKNHEETDVDFEHTILHELGHALGLSHSFEGGIGGATMPSALEGVEYTVMSYTVSARFSEATWADLWPQTYMYHDIVVLQRLYGKDTVTTAGTDVYTFDTAERYLQTVWDYGGSDTLAVSGSKAVHVNLAPGSWSNVGTDIQYWSEGTGFFEDSYTLYIADDTIIENATGASGNDTIQGNDAANRLIGNDGDDRMEGGAGNDVLRGGAGSDQSFGGEGNDQLWAGGDDNGNDTVVGGEGNDIAAGAAGDDLLVGGGVNDGTDKQLAASATSAVADGSDTLYGGSGADTIVAGGWDDSAVTDNGRFDHGEQVTSGAGNDVIWSGDDSDAIYGADGNDLIGGGQGDDTIYAAGGNDSVYGGKGDSTDTGTNDYIDLGAGNDVVFSGAGSDVIYGQAGADGLFSGGGNDTVDGGVGDDTLWGGAGNDTFTGGEGADTFVFASGHGDDRVTDFDATEDVLFLANATTDFQSAADVQAAASEQSGGVLIDIGGGDSVLLVGLSLNDLASVTYVFN